MKNFMALFLFFAFSLCFPQTVFFPGPQIKLTQAPFWLDMKDLQLIELGMKKDEINKIIGNPVQLVSYQKSSLGLIEKWMFRFREFGYKYERGRFITELDRNSTNYCDNTGNLIFEYNNNSLTKVSYKESYNDDTLSYDQTFYYPNTSLIKKRIDNGDIVFSPLWIDLEDISKVKIGMNEQEIISEIGLPAQFIQMYSSNNKKLKEVMYRVRELFTKKTDKKRKFEWFSKESHYIKIKKEESLIYVDPFKVYVGSDFIKYIDENNKENIVKKKTVEKVVLGEEIQDLKMKNVKHVNQSGTGYLEISASWSDFSYALMFSYHDGVLQQIIRLP